MKAEVVGACIECRLRLGKPFARFELNELCSNFSNELLISVKASGRETKRGLLSLRTVFESSIRKGSWRNVLLSF